MLRAKLAKAGNFVFITYSIFAAFGAYFCMYAFRKPFSVGTFDGQDAILGDLGYKSALVMAQVMGYALSKFIGIKIISELRNRYRAVLFAILILIAELALVLFAVTPAPWNIALLFLNGLPLGMIWGIVFSYLEGRRFSEILGAGLSASFILSSGAVKSVGKWLTLHFGVNEFWMPAATGALFLLPLLLFIYLLEQIPPPTPEDIRLRTERQPMSGAARKALFFRFAPGFILLIAFYTLLTAYRDLRDNFAVEIWSALGFGDTPSIFTISEIPIAVIVLATMGATMLIQDNRKALSVYLWLILAGAALIGGSTILLQQHLLGGGIWMVLVGLGLYIAYVPFNCILFDRMIAAFRYKANAGFLIYVADAFGYMGSVAILVWKDFGEPDISWLSFFKQTSYVLAFSGFLLIIAAVIYFARKLSAPGLQQSPA